MFLRRFVAFLCLFALSQVPLALASVIHEWETISLFLSAGGDDPSEPVRTASPEVRRRPIAPGKKAGDVKKIRYGGLVYRFRWCPPGEFTMGSPESEGGRNRDETSHAVRLTRGFWLLDSEVTQAMWKSVMEPGVTADDQKTAKKTAKLYKVYPMGYVGLDDARSFCKVFGSETGCAAALPTEAQWEYACRAGTIGPFAGTGDPAEMGWSVEQTGNGDEVNPIGVHRVKTRRPNAWGLYDMHGNLSEWVADRYGEYDRRPQVDPKGPDEGESGICRGGSVLSDPNQCRSASRISRAAGECRDDTGFRILLVPDEPESERTAP
ncbi:MAG: formylglycine-generating enzyme family protein [Thermoguttaceae bacterium]|nr:formylglycine-generating enzyme family protein [Thermoguttaceae bacterium]